MKDRYIVPLLVLVAVDIAVFVGAFVLAYGLRFCAPVMALLPPPEVPPFEPYLILALCVAALGISVFERFGFYRHRYGLERRVGTIGLIAAVVVTYVFAMAALFNYRGMSYSRLTVAFALPGTVLLTVMVGALLSRANDFLMNHGIGCFRTALVGTAEHCADLIPRLRQTFGSEYNVVGYIGPEAERKSAEADAPERLGDCSSLGTALRERRVDHVILALPGEGHEEHREIITQTIEACDREGFSLQMIPELFEALCTQTDVGAMRGYGTIPLGITPLNGPGSLIKRVIDLAVSGTLLVILSPVMALVTLLIKLDSRGEVIFSQERIGNDGQTFVMYKFRSMQADAEGHTGPVWAKADDPRCTWMGWWLRRTNLDELPQLYNVLRGDMSLVGPRPERPYFVNKFKESIPMYMRRHVVKSGITGWAQVNGLRGDTSVEERIKYDMYYVENWSLALDIRILWRTLSSFKNAY